MFKKIALILVFVFISQSVFGASALYLLKKKRLAIVIDDMGYDVGLARGFEKLGLPLAFSFLPDAPYTQELSKEFAKNGYIVMIHMPSQPLDYPKNNPGKNAIYLWTSKRKTFELLERALNKIPDAVGLNNHEGSAILRDKRHIDWILEFLKEHKMFFVDSYTVKDSLGCIEAKKIGVLCQRRRVFLDNVADVGYIEGQIRKAIEMLKRRDVVLAIGHCRPKTLIALRRMRKELKPYLVNVVFVLR
ncbi:divergent polysaccharide deacetylase family protein [Hippea alviniae]|uniref:divergent polysaccharide deacetylase family protein n=1 Tax=Hippea alviniae TaxID=1279027 RepID=UPI0003B42934|nr:divergent polysaccharide deacetylase family protein [Hippea alviniae]